MKRISTLLAILALVFAVSATGCQRKVDVQTGTRVVCTNGEVVSEDVKTIAAPSGEAANYRIKTQVITCDTHSGLTKLYDEAQAALKAGDLKTAEAKLTQVVASNATYRQAQTQLDEIKAGKKPTPDTGGTDTGGGTTTPPKPSTAPTSTASGALTSWIPDALSGWTAQKPTVDLLSASREYLPSGGSRAVNLVIAAEQYSSATDAKAALDRQVKRVYTKNAAMLTVNGHSAYFGTDGTRFAVLAFTAGPIMVALEADAKSGAPKDLRATLESAAKQLP